MAECKKILTVDEAQNIDILRQHSVEIETGKQSTLKR